jgi:hypothetical protein
VYYNQLLNYLKFFDIANFLFLEQSELNEPQKALSKIGQFLGMKIDIAETEEKRSNKGAYEHCLDDNADVIRELKEFYRPHNENLFQLIGMRYNWNDQ